MYKNGVAVQTKYEVFPKAYKSPHFVVFSNSSPDKENLTRDRWHIIRSLKDDQDLHSLFPPSPRFATAGMIDPIGDDRAGSQGGWGRRLLQKTSISLISPEKEGGDRSLSDAAFKQKEAHRNQELLHPRRFAASPRGPGQRGCNARDDAKEKGPRGL